jgi:uncharacterized phage-associated protein
MLTADDIAKYFLKLSDDPGSGELLSNLTVQKLCYYAQGFHLALYGKPLFKEKIEAWTHGPVIPTLYHKYKEYGAGPIPIPEDFDPNKYDAQTKELLNEVYEVYGQYSAWKLRNMTHGEPPWLEAKETAGEISLASMEKYFKTLLF